MHPSGIGQDDLERCVPQKPSCILCLTAYCWRQALQAVAAEQVQQELSNPAGHFTLERLVTFLSPVAEDFLEPMAQQARQLTIQRFGRTIQLYAPLYVSNVCINSCKYNDNSCQSNDTGSITRNILLR